MADHSRTVVVENHFGNTVVVENSAGNMVVAADNKVAVAGSLVGNKMVVAVVVVVVQ